MKVAIDSGPLKTGHKVRGIGVHTRELIDAIKEETKKRDDIEIKVVDFTRTDLNKYDLVHYQHFHPFYKSIPKDKPDAKTILTIHDLFILIYPDNYPPGIQGKLNFKRNKRLLKNIDSIITISETSKKDICRYMDINPKIVHVVHLAQRNIFKKIENTSWKKQIKEKYKLPNKFVLYVGDVNYIKNIPALIRACRQVKTQLVIVGKQAKEIEEKGVALPSVEGPRDWARFLFSMPHPELSHFKEILEECEENNVTRAGFVKDEDLVKIYNLATVYCQPSFYEGFGFPVLEAMSCGTPVVASKTQALVEVAGDAVIYMDPNNEKDMANKLKGVLNSKTKREKLVQKGFNKVEEYSWQKTAKETLKVYEEVTK